MTIKQLSVFIENRDGSLAEVASKLAENGINIASLSLADTSDYGMLRMVVSEPKRAKEILKEAGFSAMITEVIAIKLPNKMGTLNDVLVHFAEKNISIEYMYVLSTSDISSIIMKITDVEKGVKTLLDNGFELLSNSEAEKINQV